MEKQKDKSNWLRLPLQYFADGGDGGSGDGGTGGTDGADGGTGDEKPLTLAEVQALIQSETDKVRTDWSKKNKDLQKQLDDEKKSKMTEQQKLELAQDELKEKELKLSQKENRIFAISALSDESVNLPTSFLEFVTSDSEENTTAKIKVLKTEFDKAVAAAVEETFKGTGRKPPKGSTGGSTGSMDYAAIAAKNNIRNQ